jgi:hypothetical protein
VANTDLVDRVKARFANFLFLVWRHLGLPAPTPLQYEMADYLQYGPRRAMIQAFRGIGKSWITAAFVLWLLLCDPQLKILVVSASADRSNAFSIFVRKLIEDMPILSHLRPREKQRDSAVLFDVGPALPSQSPSMKAAGITGQITGSRADVIVADDIEVPKNSLTQLMRDRLSEGVKEFDAILTTNREKNRIIYLGTPQTEMSVYNDLPARGFQLRIWPARVPSLQKVQKHQERYEKLGGAGDLYAASIASRAEDPSQHLLPTDTRFTHIDLVERANSYGRSGFALQFMLDTAVSDAERYPLKLADLLVHDADAARAPVHFAWGSGVDQVINELDAIGLEGDRWHRPIKLADEWAEYAGCVMFIDPSGRGTDETSYAVVKHLYGTLHLTRVGGFKDGYSEATLEALAKAAKEEGVKQVVIEPNYGGGMFNELFKPVLHRTLSQCAVDEAEWSKGQKEKRIIDVLEPVMNQHRLVVARRVVEDDLAQAKEDRDYSLFYQMTRLTKERGSLAHDDRVEAVAGAVYVWVQSMAQETRKAENRHKEKALEKELEKFKNQILGRKPRPTTMFNPRRA